MPIIEIITAIKDLSLTVAGVVTAVVAIRGLRNWNRELKGKAAFEVARGLAKATYRLRDEIRMCRSPLLTAREFPEGYGELSRNKTPENEAQAYAHIFTNRWNSVFASLQEFDTQTLEAEALWNNSIREKTDALRKLVRKLNVAIEAFIANERSGGKDFSSDKEFGRDIRSTVFASPTDADNKLSASIESSISFIQDELRPHLRRA